MAPAKVSTFLYDWVRRTVDDPCPTNRGGILFVLPPPLPPPEEALGLARLRRLRWCE